MESYKKKNLKEDSDEKWNMKKEKRNNLEVKEK